MYDELRALAAHHLARERRDHTLQPTAVVHEAWLRLRGVEEDGSDGHRNFLAMASRAIRQVLVDHARHHNAEKSGGEWQRVTLDDGVGLIEGMGVDVLALNEALERLSALSERQARVVELRFFGGLSGDEIAAILGVTRRTIQDDWKMAQTWLFRELGRGPSG